MNTQTICMYGAASDKIDSLYIEAVEKLGKEIADRKHKLIYGGGASGLMGACSRGAAEAGGVVIGVVPTFMNDFEPINDACTQVIKTETMGERKQIMEENSDAFVIVPGGIGTFDEFFQILTLKELRRKSKPIILFNVNGFYDDLISLIDSCIKKGFIRPAVTELFEVCSTPKDALDQIEQTASVNA